MACTESSSRASLQRRGDGVRARDLAAERAALALPADDLAHRVDEGDLRPAVEAEPARRALRVPPGRDALRVLQAVAELVRVEQLVDQARVEGGGAVVGPGVDDGLRLVRGLVARRADARDVLLVDAVEQRLHLLAVRLREAGLRELVGRVLVLPDPLELRLHAELVEGVGEERGLRLAAPRRRGSRWGRRRSSSTRWRGSTPCCPRTRGGRTRACRTSGSA